MLPVWSSTKRTRKNRKNKQKHRSKRAVHFDATRACKPGSVLTAIYLALQLPIRSSRLPGTVGQTMRSSTALLRDRVYSVKPMLPWAGWALTPPFHPYLAAVSFCCTCPGVTPGGRYPLSLPCEARTFLIRSLSACVRGCPARSREYCNPWMRSCQMSCKIFSDRIYYHQKTMEKRKNLWFPLLTDILPPCGARKSP